MTNTYDPESHYDRVTDAWTLLLGEDLHYGVFRRGDEDLPTATAELTDTMRVAAQLSAGAHVLDVGCGTGSPACRLAEKAEVRVTGITTSQVGVAAATERAKAEGVADRVRFEQRDGTNNLFDDETFDRVWVLESAHLMPERERLMKECARVLRPNGHFVLCDIILGRPMPFAEVRRLRQPLALLRDVFGAARMESLSRYAEMARDEGLTVDQEMDLTELTRPTFSRWRDNAYRHREEVSGFIGASDWQRFVDACDVLEGFWDDGTLGYGLLAARKG